MSSNIRIQRICKHCGSEFTGKTTVTQYCGDRCAKQAYKLRGRTLKIEHSNEETFNTKISPLKHLQAKEFLNVREVATLLGCSIRTVYYYIGSGKINAVNLSQRLTRVKRSEIDKLFEQPASETVQDMIQYNLSDFYSMKEVETKYGISEKALYELIKRNSIPKIKNSRNVFVPKILIDKIMHP